MKNKKKTEIIIHTICGKTIRVINYEDYKKLESQSEVLNSEILKLKAQLWIVKDSQLRTYDGLTDKADSYDLIVNNTIFIICIIFLILIFLFML